jgi:lipoyl(octanoyl) transferase
MNLLSMNKWRLIDSGPNLGVYNMAVDEELLARAQAGEHVPVLRFYTWDPAAVSIGRFQKIKDAVNAAACEQRGIDIVRRITGGRAVLHHRELTYSVIARTEDPIFPPNVLGTYKLIASGLLQGLKNLGIHAEMVSRSNRHAHLVKKNTRDPACFSSPSWYEILVHGRKIIGSAQRRLSCAFLQHGSILMDFDTALEAEVIRGGGSADCVTTIRKELGKAVPLDEVKQAFLKGFSEALAIDFGTRNPIQSIFESDRYQKKGRPKGRPQI